MLVFAFYFFFVVLFPSNKIMQFFSGLPSVRAWLGIFVDQNRVGIVQICLSIVWMDWNLVFRCILQMKNVCECLLYALNDNFVQMPFIEWSIGYCKLATHHKYMHCLMCTDNFSVFRFPSFHFFSPIFFIADANTIFHRQLESTMPTISLCMCECLYV